VGVTIPASPAYSKARRAAGLLFVSGQLGVRDGALVGGIEGQTRQALTNLGLVLAEHGLAMDGVVKCDVFLSSMTHWNAMNAVFAEVFGVPYPARTAVAVELIAGALVEIDAVALL
jgi:2-iminobutanoate/2-iminopropanoate deaminase